MFCVFKSDLFIFSFQKMFPKELINILSNEWIYSNQCISNEDNTTVIHSLASKCLKFQYNIYFVKLWFILSIIKENSFTFQHKPKHIFKHTQINQSLKIYIFKVQWTWKFEYNWLSSKKNIDKRLI